MNRRLRSVLVVAFLVIMACCAQLARAGDGTSETAQGIAEPMPLGLDGTEWKVSLMLKYDDKNRVIPEVVTFEEGKFTAKDFEKDGFKPSAYSLERDGDLTTWRGEQKKEGAAASWRGDFSDGTMRGAVIVRTDGEEAKSYSFMARMVKGELIRSASEIAEEKLADEKKEEAAKAKKQVKAKKKVKKEKKKEKSARGKIADFFKRR
ncbi:hypothetical protein ACFL3N_00290 [Candidatus Omnitrophota bacterium]